MHSRHSRCPFVLRGGRGDSRRVLGSLRPSGIPRRFPNKRDRQGNEFRPYEPALVAAAVARGHVCRCVRFPGVDGGVPSQAEMVQVLDAIDGELRLVNASICIAGADGDGRCLLAGSPCGGVTGGGRRSPAAPGRARLGLVSADTGERTRRPRTLVETIILAIPFSGAFRFTERPARLLFGNDSRLR